MVPVEQVSKIPAAAEVPRREGAVASSQGLSQYPRTISLSWMPQEDVLRREYLVHVAHLGSQLLEAELKTLRIPACGVDSRIRGYGL